jgi:hypothetical protein
MGQDSPLNIVRLTKSWTAELDSRESQGMSITPQHPDRPWVSSSLLHKGYLGFCPQNNKLVT